MTNAQPPDQKEGGYLSQPDPLRNKVDEFLVLSRGWLQDIAKKFAQEGIVLQHPPQIIHVPQLSGATLGAFKTMPQLRLEISESAGDIRQDWKKLFEHFRITVDESAYDQIESLQHAQHPLQALLKGQNERDIFVPLQGFSIAQTPPIAWPSLQQDLIECVWSLIEAERGLEPDADYEPGLRRWVRYAIPGKTSELLKDMSEEHHFAVHVRSCARMIKDVLAAEAQPLSAALNPTVRAEIQQHYEKRIQPKLDELHNRYLLECLAGEENFSWLKEDTFRAFRHQPSLTTFCQGLRHYGFERLAQELERQPESCAEMITSLRALAETAMEPFRYTTDDVKKGLAEFDRADTDPSRLETTMFVWSIFLWPILEEFDVLTAENAKRKFANIPEEKIPADLLPLFQRLVSAEKKLATRQTLPDISAQDRAAIEGLLKNGREKPDDAEEA